ncbi:hypothetical protein ACET3Z_005986 [Daucus carota]
MSLTEFAVLLVLIAAFWPFLRLCKTIFPKTSDSHQKPPPGPSGLPVIGHLHMLGKLPHQTLYKLSQKYGPIMSLRLGSVPTIVVTSPGAAELFLRTHDAVFASRPKMQVAENLWYGSKGMIFTEYGAYWRNVRKFCTLGLLSASKIDSFAGRRRKELGMLVESLKKSAGAGEVVDVSEKVAHLTVDMTCKMLFGEIIKDKCELNEIIHEMAEIMGAFNIADYVPLLGALDLQGWTRRIRAASKTVDRILETIIDDHEEDACKGHNKPHGDFVDIILSLKNSERSTHEHLAQIVDRTNIKAILLDMIFGSIDTSQITIEWIMSELMRHPRMMQHLQAEIRNVISDCEFVEESHLSKLTYLDMVVKEGMRLHPAGPLLVHHESMEDIMIDGYHIPKQSRIIVNIWGMARDPKIWSANAEEFCPERFMDSNIDLRGKNFELIPFGSGRRICPGMYLGLINVKLVVAQLVHSFNWELPSGMSPAELDMDEMFGATVPRANHLLAVPTLRFP